MYILAAAIEVVPEDAAATVAEGTENVVAVAAIQAEAATIEAAVAENVVAEAVAGSDEKVCQEDAQKEQQEQPMGVTLVSKHW